MTPLKVIAFDADDTLWHNEHYFREAEEKFWALMEDFLPPHTTARELLTTEMQNIALYGYGIKAFVLSMVETAIRITDGRISAAAIQTIIDNGKDILGKPVELLDGVEETLQALQGSYRLVVATKGDLLDQERKLRKSGLARYFHHIEIMSEKHVADYEKLIRHLDIAPAEFMMVGNSVKSDILPVLNTGGAAIHIPYHITWAHEHAEVNVEHPRFRQCARIHEVVALISGGV